MAGLCEALERQELTMRDEPECAGLLRRLAVSDDGTIGSIFAGEITDLENSELGDKTRALVRLAALIATESAAPSYQWAVSVARAAGVSDDEVTGVLMSVAPIVGIARVASAAPGARVSARLRARCAG